MNSQVSLGLCLGGDVLKDNNTMRYSKNFQMSIVQFTTTFTKPYKVKLVNQ